MNPVITLMLLGVSAWLSFLSVKVFNRHPVVISGPLKLSWCILGSSSAWMLWVILTTRHAPYECLSWIVIGAALVIATDRRRT